MIDKLLNFDKNSKNINLFLEHATFSSFFVNLFVPLLLFYIVQDFIEIKYLYVLSIVHVIIFILRFSIIKKLINSKIKNNIKTRFFKILVFLIIIASSLNSFLIAYSILSDIPQVHVFILSIIVVVISAGSVSTLLGIYEIYVAFILLSILPLIGSIVYRGDDLFYLFAFTLSIFMILILKIGQKNTLLINNLSSLKETFQIIFEKSSDGIILIKNNRFKDCNQAVVDMLGCKSKKNLLDNNISKFMPKYQDDGTLSIKKMMKMTILASKSGHYTFEWQFRKNNGENLWVDFALNKINIDGEELLHGIFRDISKRKELELEKEKFKNTLEDKVKEEIEKNKFQNELMQQQYRLAQVGEMLSMIAHQWRQPLSAITAATGVITLKSKMGKLDSQTAQDLADRIKNFSMHLSSTINDFRDFFKPNKVKDQTSYKKVIDSVLSIIESSLIKNNIEIVQDIKNIEEFESYENELKQVLLNLIKNAEDILLENEVKKPKIILSVDGGTLSVSDNAGGIPEDIIDKIYEPYFSTKLKKDGTGIGLYMSKIIIEEHCNGKLSVLNDENGAVFKIELQILQNLM